MKKKKLGVLQGPQITPQLNNYTQKYFSEKGEKFYLES
jgi:hypothetical protein